MCVCVCLHACVLSCSVVSDSFMKTPQTIACQVPLSRGFFREEYCSQLPFPSPGDLPDPGIELTSPSSPALAGGFCTTEPLGKPSGYIQVRNNKGLYRTVAVEYISEIFLRKKQ